MLLIHLKDGTVHRLDPRQPSHASQFDSSDFRKQITRISIIDLVGRRVDLPANKRLTYVIGCELIYDQEILKGERIYMQSADIMLSALLYYSDNRVVIDLSGDGYRYKNSL